MIGRFLEISLPTPDIRASLEFYESLGFEQATTADTWSYPYAVVTDGHLFLGRWGDRATFTFVVDKPDVARPILERKD